MKHILFDYPKEVQKSVQDVIRLLHSKADLKAVDDDQKIEDWLKVNNLPLKEKWVNTENGSAGNLILWCDGNRSYVIAGFSGHKKKKKNGYAMISIKTDPVREMTQGDAKKLWPVVASLCIVLGFKPEKALKDARVIDLLDPATN